MASSKLRTHQGKSTSNKDGSRSTIMDLLQRDPTADQLQHLSGSLQSVRLDGGVLTVVATEKVGGTWSTSHVQTPHLAHAAVPEFVISDRKPEGDPPSTREAKLDGARQRIRGFHEL